MIGSLDQNMLIIERQWESLAAMEAAYESVMVDPKWQALGQEVVAVLESSQVEVFTPLP